MLFNSFAFLFVFLPVTLIGYYALKKRGMRNALAFVLFASICFYGMDEEYYVILLLSSIVFNYYIAIYIASLSGKRKRLCLVAGVGVNVATLVYFKYMSFLCEIVKQLFGLHFPVPHIPLPPGISFYTFIQIAYLVDAYRKSSAAGGSLLNYSFFVSFFPHLIAGPIIHITDMMPQLGERAKRPPLSTRMAVGLTVLVLGLAKKVLLADPLGRTADAAYAVVSGGGHLGTGAAWVGTLCYTLQIYFDFSGYSDMAIGLAYLFGIRFPTNFESPYKAFGIVDFWRRWHITLSTFLRDYIYIPLGGNRSGQTARMRNLMITMLIAGAWHGAGWTFIIWGGIHGLALVCTHAYRHLFGRKNHHSRLGQVCGVLLTFLFVHLAWVFFRAESLDIALRMFHEMFRWNVLHVRSSVPREMFLGLSIVWFMPNVRALLGTFAPHLEGFSGEQFLAGWRPNVISAVALGVIFTLSLFALRLPSAFIYFRF